MICRRCGAELPEQAILMCSVCGKKSQKCRRKKEELSIMEVVGEAVDDGYDGYYDDVLPPDADRIEEGVDKGLIKDIILLCVAVVLIIVLCVAMLYVL
jgi:ribosomal protein L40E